MKKEKILAKLKSSYGVPVSNPAVLEKVSVCRFKSQLYLAPSSGISIVWRGDSWRGRHAPPQLAALQTMEMPLDVDNTKDS